jgi:hypothetical protein
VGAREDRITRDEAMRMMRGGSTSSINYELVVFGPRRGCDHAVYLGSISLAMTQRSWSTDEFTVAWLSGRQSGQMSYLRDIGVVPDCQGQRVWRG